MIGAALTEDKMTSSDATFYFYGDHKMSINFKILLRRHEEICQHIPTRGCELNKFWQRVEETRVYLYFN
jgi:hypothetical protein